IVACRARNPVGKKVREKLALYSSVPIDRVFSMHDCESIYFIPEMLRAAGLDTAVIDILNLRDRVHPEAEAKAVATWGDYMGRMRSASPSIPVRVTGNMTSLPDSYARAINAFEHASSHCGVRLHIDWIDTTEITADNVAAKLAHCDAVLTPGGFGVRGAEGKIACIRHARTTGLP